MNTPCLQEKTVLYQEFSVHKHTGSKKQKFMVFTTRRKRGQKNSIIYMENYVHVCTPIKGGL